MKIVRHNRESLLLGTRGWNEDAVVMGLALVDVENGNYQRIRHLKSRSKHLLKGIQNTIRKLINII
jgi:hypothetical protein